VRAGLEVTIRRSKTDQEAKGALLVIPYGSQLETCPGESAILSTACRVISSLGPHDAAYEKAERVSR